MSLRIHHLDCATMCPRAGRWLGHGHFVGHCWLVETTAGLVLVDTGFGVDDARRVPGWFRATLAPQLGVERTAVAQVERLGYTRDDVRHIVLTHLDLDHAGGLSDFPRASVHVQRREHAAALARRGVRARLRYLPEQWAHDPRWALHGRGDDEWHGFRAVREVPGLPDDILLVPLEGHTAGHQAIAVLSDHGWLLHVGDLWPSRERLTGGAVPPSVGFFERFIAQDWPVLLHNQARIRALHHDHPEIRVVCAHDPGDLRDCQSLTP